MPRECWARNLGGCSGKMSAEHYLSRASFPDGATLTLPGWTEPRKVGAAAMTSKVLCQHHNSMLSPPWQNATAKTAVPQ